MPQKHVKESRTQQPQGVQAVPSAPCTYRGTDKTELTAGHTSGCQWSEGDRAPCAMGENNVIPPGLQMSQPWLCMAAPQLGN